MFVVQNEFLKTLTRKKRSKNLQGFLKKEKQREEKIKKGILNFNQILKNSLKTGTKQERRETNNLQIQSKF